MADLHHQHVDSSTTVVHEDYDRDGPATALLVLLILAFVGFLIWLLAFSGIFFHTNSGGSTTTNNVRIQQPATQPSSNTGGTGGGSSSPMPS